MDIFDKRRLGIREEIFKNKEKVLNDIIELRKKSTGISVKEYIENLNNFFDFLKRKQKKI